MSYARQMLDSYRRSFNIDAGLLAATIDALNDCAQACTADVDADLGEQHVPELIKCIRLCLDCADVCAATATITSRLAEYDSIRFVRAPAPPAHLHLFDPVLHRGFFFFSEPLIPLLGRGTALTFHSRFPP